MSDEVGTEATARLLFRYITVEEWRDYRAVMTTFSGTFFAELTPDDVHRRLTADGSDIELAVVADRLEALRRWGNLTVSSSVGSPTSLDDYYKRRSRYLITRAGQEVADLVEGVLSRVDEVRDVSTGRLRSMRDALLHLGTLDIDSVDPIVLADAVRAVFDPHAAFTLEITQFFASINQWQSRYDLTPDELRFFAEVLVGYVSERLDEIERTARPISRYLVVLEPRVAAIVARMSHGLAGRIDEAGLGATVAATRSPGSTLHDWANLSSWFVARGRELSRIDRLGREAVAAIRTLTINLTRLSRVGIGASSRRADFVRLAGFFAEVGGGRDNAHRLAAAAFGIFPARHLGLLSADADDPESVATAWRDAPRALVPISLRERGDVAPRGKATPLRDRRQEQLLLRRRREEIADDERAVDAELAGHASLDGVTLSVPAFRRLLLLVGRTAQQGTATTRTWSDRSLACAVTRVRGTETVLRCSEGRLTLRDLQVTITRNETPATPVRSMVGGAAS